MTIRSRVTILALVVGCSIAADADRIDSEGGLVKLGGKGTLVIIDCRETPNNADFEQGLNALALKFPVQTRIERGDDFSVESAAGSVHKRNANAAVFIVEHPALPLSLLASEERWASINVKRLNADAPTIEVFRRRLSKMLVRQCYRLLGSDATKNPRTCLYPVFSLQDLDAIQGYDLSAWAQMSISEAMPRIGLDPEVYGTYRDACEAGLAPPPTNSIQRKIWKLIHAPPSKPLKITYDKGKQKPVVK